MAPRSAKTILVGAGGYGSVYYLKHILDNNLPEVELTAIVDPFVQHSPHYEALQKRQIPAYASLDECFHSQGDVDLVIISSPIHLHEEHIQQSAGHCRAILCEKPLVPSLDAAQKVLRIHREQTPVAVGFQWSFSKAITELKQDIHRGRFGKALGMKALLLWPRDFNYYARNSWAGRIQSNKGELILDSPLSNATAHYLHNLFFLLGDTPETSAKPKTIVGSAFRCNNIENFDTATLKIVTTQGVKIGFYTTHAGVQSHTTRFDLTFEKALVSYGPTEQTITARLSNGEEVCYGNPDADEAKKIRDCVQLALDGTPVLCNAETALPHVLSVNAFQKCIGTPLDFPPDLIEQNERQAFISPLDDWMKTCYEKNCLLSDLGLDWATPNKTIDLTDMFSTV